MTAVVVSLADRRQMQTLSAEVTRLQRQLAALRLEGDPGLRSRVLMGLLAERQLRAGALCRVAGPPLAEALALALAAQVAAGEEPDFELALALVTGSRAFLDLGRRVDAILAEAPAAMLRLPPEVLAAPPPEAAS